MKTVLWILAGIIGVYFAYELYQKYQANSANSLASAVNSATTNAITSAVQQALGSGTNLGVSVPGGSTSIPNYQGSNSSFYPVGGSHFLPFSRPITLSRTTPTLYESRLFQGGKI